MSTDAAVTEGAELVSRADGGIVAEVRLDHADLVLRPTMRRASEVTIEPDYWTTVTDGRTLLFFTGLGDSFGAFETALGADPTVTDPVLVDRFSDRRVYRVELTERALPFTAKTAEAGGRVLETTSSRDGWIVQLRFPDRDGLIEFNDYCRDRGITFQVNHLRTAEGGEDRVVALTPKQQELLTLALEEGYFDVPRGISQNELADRMGVSKSAISQRLRRAIGELCETTLACGRTE